MIKQNNSAQIQRESLRKATTKKYNFPQQHNAEALTGLDCDVQQSDMGMEMESLKDNN